MALSKEELVEKLAARLGELGRAVKYARTTEQAAGRDMTLATNARVAAEDELRLFIKNLLSPRQKNADEAETS